MGKSARIMGKCARIMGKCAAAGGTCARTGGRWVRAGTGPVTRQGPGHPGPVRQVHLTARGLVRPTLPHDQLKLKPHRTTGETSRLAEGLTAEVRGKHCTARHGTETLPETGP
jgi:hypothetical protein